MWAGPSTLWAGCLSCGLVGPHCGRGAFTNDNRCFEHLSCRHRVDAAKMCGIALPGIHNRCRLCGIIYCANYHFVCRFVNRSGGIWYYDGQNNNNMLYYGNIVNFATKQHVSAGPNEMCMLLYTDYV